MAGITAEDQVAKKCYRNQTAGWLGVVKLDHLGAQVGHPIEPHGTVYLSDAEAILTARAPKDPKDNPFVEQAFMFVDEYGKHVEAQMAPLVLVSDEEGIPSDDRYVPGLDLNPAAIVANHEGAQQALDDQEERPRQVPTAPVEPVLVPATAAAVDPAFARPANNAPVHQGVHADQYAHDEHSEVAEGGSWVDAPNRTAAPQRGSLGGSNDAAPGAGPDPTAPGRIVRPQAPAQGRPAPTTVASSDAAPDLEEHAASRDRTAPSESAGTQRGAGAPSEQEETGASVPARGDAPEGEFAAHEEVGSPEAAGAKGGEGE